MNGECVKSLRKYPRAVPEMVYMHNGAKCSVNGFKPSPVLLVLSLGLRSEVQILEKATAEPSVNCAEPSMGEDDECLTGTGIERSPGHR